MSDKLTEYEKDLIIRFKFATEKKQQAESALDIATDEFNEIENEIRKFLEDDGNRKKTGDYNGLGHVTIIERALSASIEEGRLEDVMQYVKSIDREDIIKTSIHPKTLSTFIEDLLKNNQPLPPGVTFYRPRKARFYPAKD